MIQEDDLLILIPLGESIRSHRKLRKVTQRVIADRTGIDQGIISKIESGQINPTFTTLYRLAVALEVKVADLVNIDFKK
ncbi:helix-turn-helix domain-containing protein [Chitinophaga horti]|uniref:helix-turn-helix domain-containing protein n=1 Tax=Chitinophaga horti TaxID=2920382 RepID=UPI003D8131BC